jgi:hypothetical protein
MAILMVPKYLIFFVLLIPVAIQDDGILVVPTMAYLPPKLDGKEILSEEYQSSSFSLLSIASLSGCCQVKLSLSLSLSHSHTHTHTCMCKWQLDVAINSCFLL